MESYDPQAQMKWQMEQRPQHANDSVDKDQTPAWVKGVEAAEADDKRKRPWKETFGNSVDVRMDQEPEIVSTTKRSRGGAEWCVMGQSLGA